MTIIIAFDPGETTGVAVGQHTGGRDFDLIESWEIPWERRTTVHDALEEFRPNFIVVESFRLYAHKARQQIGSHFPSVRVIGMIELSAHLWGLGELFFQTPSLISQVKIPRELEVENTFSGSEHRKDAYKHLRYFVLSKGPKL